MTKHLDYEKNSSAGDNSGNNRYWHAEKTVLLENQSAVIQVSRDRNSAFEPEIIPNHKNRISLFNIIHRVRDSTKFVLYKDLKKVRAGLKAVSPCMALPPPVRKPEGRRLRISAERGTPRTP
jgi:transposase-like protein